jgi:hypothetical protein
MNSTLSQTERSSTWWLGVLRRRAQKIKTEHVDLSQPIAWSSEDERLAAVRFFNAAFRAEESGLRQAHELADQVAAWDGDLAEVLRLYGNEEGWHRELIEEFLGRLGGGITPMGRVTRFFYAAYARARRIETIVLTNLLFETIGATTYRMALRNVQHASARSMLIVLTRDESFHVPLNVHFLSRVLARDPRAIGRARLVYRLLFVSLLLLPLASRPKAQAFDGVSARDLQRGYARALAALFLDRPELGLEPPWWLLRLLGVRRSEVRSEGVTSSSAAERAAERDETIEAL